MIRYLPLLLIAATGFAAINTCPTLQTSGNVGYPVAGPNDTVYGAGTFTGCQVVNAVFSNFLTQNTSGTYIGSAVTAAQSSDPLVTTPTFRLATERGNFSVANDLDNNDGNNNWSTASTGLIGGTVNLLATTTGLSIYELSFVFNGVVHGTGGTVGITPIFCLGGTAVASSGSLTAANCVAGGGIAVSPGLVNIAGNGTQTLNFFLPAESNRVEVTFAVNLVAGSSGSAGFNYIDLNFDEAPEPSTFILLGSALAGLVAAKFGKTKL